jgi:hypothetical protein
MKAVLIALTALLLVGCDGFYRYPCQDPANAEREECNRPACEAEGMCYDTLNGLAPPVVEGSAADCNCEDENSEFTGE